jgi:DHA2 family multidrug resistance protein
MSAIAPSASSPAPRRQAAAAPLAFPAVGAVKHRGLITISIMLATIMQALDTTIANVALPHMQGSLQASQDQISWVLTSYIVAAAIATPLAGWLCGRFGRRQVFLVAVAGFTAASALCGMAVELWQIVLARLLQGFFGAALVPLSQAVLLDINPKEKVGQAMAIWGAGIMVGPILGPVLGGWLTENANWRWVFFINLPVGLLAFYGISRFLPESRPAGERLDLFGFTTLGLAIGLLQLFLDRGQQLDWFSSGEIRFEAAGAAVAFLFFVAHTWTVRGVSFFNRALLKDRNFVTGLLFIFIVGLVLYATMALLPTLLEGLLNDPVAYTGLVMAPRGVGTMLAMIIVGRALQVIDARKIMALGFALTAVSLYQMTQITLDMGSALVVQSGFLQGLGLGMIFVPLSTVAFATLAPSLRNDGTPIFSLLRNIGSSIGISLIQTYLTQRTARAHALLAIDISPANTVMQALPPPFDAHTAVGLMMLNQEVTRQASMMGYIEAFRIMLVLTLVSMPLLLLIRATPRGAAKSAITITE